MAHLVRRNSHDEDHELDHLDDFHHNGTATANGNSSSDLNKALPPISTEGISSPPPEYDEEDEAAQAGRPRQPRPPQRQSSFAQPRANGTPRTPNRVRFNISPSSEGSRENGGLMELADEEALFREMNDLSGSGNERQPFLTALDAPMVALAADSDDDFNPEELLESARPKSGVCAKELCTGMIEGTLADK
jgi:hypothetical protein